MHEPIIVAMSLSRRLNRWTNKRGSGELLSGGFGHADRDAAVGLRRRLLGRLELVLVVHKRAHQDKEKEALRSEKGSRVEGGGGGGGHAKERCEDKQKKSRRPAVRARAPPKRTPSTPPMMASF